MGVGEVLRLPFGKPQCRSGFRLRASATLTPSERLKMNEEGVGSEIAKIAEIPKIG
jgi:hypothetical protein